MFDWANRGVHKPQVANGGGERGSADSRAGSLPDKITAAGHHGEWFMFHKLISGW
jgi:hypothetical protein